jgi:hypothetical protein
MGKAVLVVFVGLIGFGGYWFYWEDGGGNAPITIEYELNAAANLRMGMPSFNVKGDLGLCAMPDRLKISVDMKGQNMGPLNMEILLLLDKKTAYTILPDDEIYSSETFDFVPMSETEKASNGDFDWHEFFNVEVDGKWMGEEDELYYARKHTLKETPQELGGLKLEIWFTDGTKLGRRYIKGLNKLLRIDSPDGSEGMPLAFGTEDMKRPQLTPKDLPYFPIPLKIVVAFNDSRIGRLTFEAEAKKFSRKKCPKGTFQVPSDYDEVEPQELQRKLMEKFSGAAPTRRRP